MADIPTREERGMKRIGSLLDAWWKIWIIVGSLGSFIFFSIRAWLDIQASIKQGKDNKEDILFIREKMVSKEELKAIDDKITRQWGTNSEANGKQDKEIQSFRDWIKYREGYEDGKRGK